MRADLLTYLEKTNREFGLSRPVSGQGFKVHNLIEQGKVVGIKVVKEDGEAQEETE